MSSVRQFLFPRIAEINRLSRTISSKNASDPFKTLACRREITRIAVLIGELLRWEPLRFSQFLKKEGNPEMLLSPSWAAQEQIIKEEGLIDWNREFSTYVFRILEHIFYTYIYYQTYDAFSENSRDNEKKARELSSYIPPSAKILEIGPGTGPLFRRLHSWGFNIHAMDIDPEMIRQLLEKYPDAKGRIFQGNFFNFALPEKHFDLIFIESGFFLFTEMKNGELIFEIFSGIDEPQLMKGLSHLWHALNDKGQLFIGIQGQTDEVKIADNLYFTMERIQKESCAIREIRYIEKGRLWGKRALFTFSHQKSTYWFQQFQSMARNAGFSSISVSKEKQWVILSK